MTPMIAMTTAAIFSMIGYSERISLLDCCIAEITSLDSELCAYRVDNPVHTKAPKTSVRRNKSDGRIVI